MPVKKIFPRKDKGLKALQPWTNLQPVILIICYMFRSALVYSYGYRSSFCNNISWFTVSNAFLRSTKKTAVYLLTSKFRYQSLVVPALPIIVAKTHSLVIGSRKRLKDINDDNAEKPSFRVGEDNVSILENIPCLGVHLDQYSSWEEQISTVTKKVSRCLGMSRLQKVSPHCNCTKYV